MKNKESPSVDTESVSYNEFSSEIYDKLSENQSYSVDLGQCTNSWSDVEKAYRDVQKDGVVEIKLSDDDKVEHFPTVVKNDKKFDSQPIQIFFGKNVPDLKTFTI